MKKLIRSILAVMLTVSLAGCSSLSELTKDPLIANKEEIIEESKNDTVDVFEPTQEETKEETQKEEVKEEPKQEETKEEVKQEEPKKEEVKQETLKKEEPKKEEVKAE